MSHMQVSFSRIKPLVIKEFRQIARDRRSLGVLLFIPAFMLVMFGYALNLDVKHTSLAVFDQNKSKTSRDFIGNFLHSEYFNFKYYLSSSSQIDELMSKEKATMALVIPPDFSKELLAGREATVQIILDGSNASAAGTAVGYANAIIQDYSTAIMSQVLVRTGHLDFLPPIEYRPRVWYNPELKSARFLIPGLIAFILMITAVVSTSLSVVREKERGTMEQITVSPVKPLELILGKTIPFVLISLAATVAILLASYLLFGVAVKGSFLLLFLVTLVFVIACLGLGLLISTVAETQQVAFMIAVLVSMLPTFTLSGFVFPIRNMPMTIQVVTYLIPARYFLVALRGIMLKGIGITAFWNQILFLVAFAILTIGMSSVRMARQRL